jgi:60 kDa SS-A/Ro ribonucleoprotein
MANQGLFSSTARTVPPPDTTNLAGGQAYAFDPKHALAQLATTGFFGDSFYESAEDQLKRMIELAGKVDSEYLAKLAVYARERGKMKDMPCALSLLLWHRAAEAQKKHAAKSVARTVTAGAEPLDKVVADLQANQESYTARKVFDRVIDNGRMLRTFYQMLRSGVFGKKSLSYSLQRAVNNWLNEAGAGKLLSASIGDKPSLKDILRLARPTPKDNQRRALFGWLVGKEESKWAPATEKDLPEVVKTLKLYRASDGEAAQLAALDRLGDYSIRWDLLSDCAKGNKVWSRICRMMGHQALRMNLNTLERHGCFSDPELIEYVASQIEAPEEVLKAKQFPYQYFAAYMNAGSVPNRIRQALSQAATIACGNIPAFPGPALIGVDVSGSMASAVITGTRKGAHSSSMHCIHAAALVAAALYRRNPDSIIVPFDTNAYKCAFDPGDTILSLADRLAKFGGGGTACSLPLQAANMGFPTKAFAAVVIVSDNESWVDQGSRGTMTMDQWAIFYARQKAIGKFKSPKMFCLNLSQTGNTQAPDGSTVVNLGGYSDALFDVMAGHLSDGGQSFVAAVEAIVL